MKRPLGRFRLVSEDNIKTDREEIGYEGMGWIHSNKMFELHKKNNGDSSDKLSNYQLRNKDNTTFSQLLSRAV